MATWRQADSEQTRQAVDKQHTNATGETALYLKLCLNKNEQRQATWRRDVAGMRRAGRKEWRARRVARTRRRGAATYQLPATPLLPPTTAPCRHATYHTHHLHLPTTPLPTTPSSLPCRVRALPPPSRGFPPPPLYTPYHPSPTIKQTWAYLSAGHARQKRQDVFPTWFHCGGTMV